MPLTLPSELYHGHLGDHNLQAEVPSLQEGRVPSLVPVGLPSIYLFVRACVYQSMRLMIVMTEGVWSVSGGIRGSPTANDSQYAEFLKMVSQSD